MAVFELDLMVKRLEAQERASVRMVDRGISYSVFSLAVVGVFVGVAFANEPPISRWLLAGAIVQAVAFVVVVGLLIALHFRRRNLYVLPDPEQIAEYADEPTAIENVVIEAFDKNRSTIRGDRNVARSILCVALAQGAAFLLFTLCELASRV